MMINADQYIDIDDELIFKGIKDVEGPMSFKNLRKFVDDSIDYGEVNLYDHDYILNGVLPNAILTSENEDMSLEIVTNNPILHIYTGPLDGSFNKLGTAIECEKKAYDMNDIYLPKGERRIQKSIYTFKMKGE
jgi:galactose mutarotase-like enzyme